MVFFFFFFEVGRYAVYARRRKEFYMCQLACLSRDFFLILNISLAYRVIFVVTIEYIPPCYHIAGPRELCRRAGTDVYQY